MTYHFESLSRLKQLLQEKHISSVELTQHYLDHIQTYNPKINAMITICKDLALEQAKQADQAIAKGIAGPLTGIPIIHKDLFCTHGVKTSSASRMLDNFVPPYNAHIVDACQEAGLVLLGKANMDEFAMGSANSTSFYGACANPWDINKHPGGSSGGSAAAIAAGFTPLATGSDTGGSIRQPAAMCGITGLKPTYGAISRFGMIAFASSLDQAGPMARNAEDCALLMNVLAKPCKKDSTFVRRESEDYSRDLSQSIKGLKLGIVRESFDHEGLDSKVKATLEKSINTLVDLGAELVDIKLPHQHHSVACYYIIAPAEASSNLARFDGVRYGHQSTEAKDLHSLYVDSRSEGFGDEVKRRIMAGTYVLSSGFYDAYYTKAQKVRHLIMNDYQQAFSEVDLIVSPTSPTVAESVEGANDDPIKAYLADIFTISTNMAGLPGISVPAGFAHGLPVGLQITAPHFKESRLLQVAHQFQQASNWHLKTPDLALIQGGDN